VRTIAYHIGTTQAVATAGPTRDAGARNMNRDPVCAEWEPVLRAIGSAEADSVPRIHQYCDTFRCRAPRRPADQEGLLHIVDSLTRPGRQQPAATCGGDRTCRVRRQRARRDRIGVDDPNSVAGEGTSLRPAACS
jgi:hypothetical protein